LRSVLVRGDQTERTAYRLQVPLTHRSPDAQHFPRHAFVPFGQTGFGLTVLTQAQVSGLRTVFGGHGRTQVFWHEIRGLSHGTAQEPPASHPTPGAQHSPLQKVPPSQIGQIVQSGGGGGGGGRVAAHSPSTPQVCAAVQQAMPHGVVPSAQGGGGATHFPVVALQTVPFVQHV